MSDIGAEEPARRSRPTDVVIVAVWVGLVVGLFEGVGWIVIQRFGRLTELWTQVLWIAPVFDGLLFLILGLVLAGLGRVVPRRLWAPRFGLCFRPVPSR